MLTFHFCFLKRVFFSLHPFIIDEREILTVLLIFIMLLPPYLPPSRIVREERIGRRRSVVNFSETESGSNCYSLSINRAASNDIHLLFLPTLFEGSRERRKDLTTRQLSDVSAQHDVPPVW